MRGRYLQLVSLVALAATHLRSRRIEVDQLLIDDDDIIDSSLLVAELRLVLRIESIEAHRGLLDLGLSLDSWLFHER